MAKMLDMMKQAASMQRDLKKMQKQLARQTVDFENAGIKVTARGDMSIVGISISPAVLEQSTPDKLGKQLTTAVNGALSAAKKSAGAEMSKLTGGNAGLGSLLGQ